MSLFSSITFAFLYVTYEILNLYKWLIIIGAVMSWLVAFNIINTHNRFIHMVGEFLYKITEPFLRPIRKVIPVMGGLDLSPLVLFFIIMFFQMVIHSQMVRL